MAEERKKATTFGADWPGKALPVMPGDFSKYAPQGMGLDGLVVVRPWDDPLKAITSPNYYGFEAREADPVRGAPSQEPSGGVIYFDDSAVWDKVESALVLMGVRLKERDFVVFEGEACDPVSDRYLDQVRIMRKDTLTYLFRPGREAAAIATQPVTVGEFIAQFLADQRTKWNDPQYTFSRLTGTFGGDGDWAKESLCFGFLVENGYWGIYRLWSRAWLVTK